MAIIQKRSIKGYERVRRKKILYFERVKERFDELYREACEARLTIMPGDESPNDRNWRDMLVGAVALVIDTNGDEHIFRGFNTKRTQDPDCPSRKCAEHRILDDLRESDLKEPFIAALVIVGDFQTDDESRRPCSTLHPCGACRRKLVPSRFMRSNTIIITARPPDSGEEPDFVEMHTMNTLVEHHAKS